MTLVLIQLFVVLAMIFIGARLGGIGLGIYGMVGVAILVFGFGLQPGKLPIDVMLIIVSVITAAAALQAMGGLDYMVGLAARFLKNHPDQITYYGPLTCWLFCLVAGTAHTCYSLLPIISEIATARKIRPERPLAVATIAASLGITGSPVSAATAALISTELLGGHGVELSDILLVCIPSSFVAILVASFVQNRIGRELDDDPEYLARVEDGTIDPVRDASILEAMETHPDPRARRSVIVFLLAVAAVVTYGSVPSLRPAFPTGEGGELVAMPMSEIIEIVMMASAAFILLAGSSPQSGGSRGAVKVAARGSVFRAGMNAMVGIFGIAWMGDTYFSGNLEFYQTHIAGLVTQYPVLFAAALFVMSIMLFSQAATVRTLYPLGLSLGLSPLSLVAMFPAVNGYFFFPNYPTEVAAINFDRTGSTRVGRWVVNHSFQLAGFITTFVSIGLGYLIISFM